jgi:hypothetical protein
VRDRCRHGLGQGVRAGEEPRLEKLLEDALIKVSAVASTLDTLSVRDMLEALIAGPLRGSTASPIHRRTNDHAHHPSPPEQSESAVPVAAVRAAVTRRLLNTHAVR